MAKLEEISEMLVSEIKDFEEAVKRLGEIQKAKITIDIAELKKVLSTHEAELRSQTATVQQVQKHLESIIKNAKIYPKWAVIFFIISLILNFVAAAFLFLHFILAN